MEGARKSDLRKVVQAKTQQRQVHYITECPVLWTGSVDRRVERQFNVRTRCTSREK